ncbi:cupin domain-containing protein [Spirillospora sp. CA-255316]
MQAPGHERAERRHLEYALRARFRACRTALAAGVRFPPSRGTVVLRGSCRILADDQEPVAVGPSDVIFTPRGDGLGLAPCQKLRPCR